MPSADARVAARADRAGLVWARRSTPETAGSPHKIQTRAEDTLDPQQSGQTRIPLTPLNLRDRGPVYAGALRQLLLSQADFSSGRAEPVPEGLALGGELGTVGWRGRHWHPATLAIS